MVEPNILEEIEKKSKEIVRSNEELATRLKNNKEMIARFSQEIEMLRGKVPGERLDVHTKQELEKLKVDLEGKKELISDLIDDLKPLEMDISRRENVIDALNQRVNDQSKRIESLSKDLTENKNTLQQLTSANNEIKKKLTEKESIIKILKDKLTEKTSLLKSVDAKNSDLEQEVDAYKKQVFSLTNKIGAVEKRVFTTNDHNQKLLYELMQLKAKTKEFDSMSFEKNKILEAERAEFSKKIEEIASEESEKRNLIMKNHSKKLAIMNATVSSLKSQLDSQKKLIDGRARQEENLIREFNQKMRAVLSEKIESPNVPNISMPEAPSFSDEPSEFNMQETDNTEEPEATPYSEFNENPFSLPDSNGEPGPSRADEIIPMIEMAADNGDDEDNIKASLQGSGYSSQDIEEAFSKLNMVKPN